MAKKRKNRKVWLETTAGAGTFLHFREPQWDEESGCWAVMEVRKGSIGRGGVLVCSQVRGLIQRWLGVRWPTVVGHLREVNMETLEWFDWEKPT